MRIQHQLAPRAEQRLALMPKMLQSIEVLQMATGELLEWIQGELESNETLEMVRSEGAEVAAGADAEAGPAPQAERFDSLDPDEGFRARTEPGAEDPKHALLHSIAAPGRGLAEHVGEQLAWREVAPELERCVLDLTALLDDRGLLPLEEEALAELVDPQLLPEALDLLRSLEPRGLGARSSIDAMLQQVSASDPDFAAIEAMLTGHLESLARNKVPEVARALGLEVEDISLLIERIRALDPHPGSCFAQGAATAIHPDLVVRIENGEVVVVVDELALPVLGINEEYDAMAADRSLPRDARAYLRGKLASAREVIRAVEQRKLTLARVGVCVMRYQRGFLERGPEAIRPLRMSDVAEQLEMHTSTVSRAIAGKYVQTDRGIFRMRDFFDGARNRGGSSAGGEGRMAVKERVQRLCAEEDPSAPLSDDELVQALSGQGIRVARRTVAKYRQELGIPSSWQRRRYG